MRSIGSVWPRTLQKALLVIGVRRPGHELQAIGCQRIGRVVDRVGADGDVLDTLAFVLAQIFFDLRICRQPIC